MLKKVLLAVAIAFAGFGGVATAGEKDVHVPVHRDDRVFNKNNKCCVWCSLEVLAYHAQIEQLYFLSEDYEGPSNLGQVITVLQQRGVRYKINWEGNTSRQAIYDFLVIPCQYEHRGVAVTLVLDATHSHMLNVVHYDRKKKIVKVIDNCDPKLRIREWDWDDFHQKWNGAAVIIYNRHDPFPRYRAVWD